MTMTMPRLSLAPLSLLSLLAVASGCGTSGAVIPASNDAGTSTAAPSSPSADGGSAAAEDAAAADAGAPAEDGGAADMRIDPIEVGHAWTYDVQVLGFYPACENGVFTATTLEASQLDGKRALHVQSLCKNAGVVKYAVEGDRVLSYIAGGWHVSFDEPVADGHSWTDDYLTYVWEKKGQVTVPAGTFDDCWAAKTVASYESYILTCRGVGPVKWHYEDGFGNGYEAVLLSKSF